MQRILLLSTFLFFYVSTLAQNEKFIIDLEIGYLMYKNESVQFKTPKSLSINTSGCTGIFSLGRTKQYEFGMRIEILTSKLSGAEKFIIGKAYYVKKDNEWQEIMKIEHQELAVEPIARREKNNMFIMGGVSIDDPAFDVRLNENYYRTQ